MTDTPAAATTAPRTAPRYTPPPVAVTRPPRPVATAPVAIAIVTHALLLGIAADALLRRGPAGLGFPLWITLFAHAAVSIASRAGRAVSREATAWFATAILFAAFVAWRDASTLQFFDGLAALAALGMAGVAIANAPLALGAARLRDTVAAFGIMVLNVMFGIVRVATGERLWKELNDRFLSRVGPVARVTLIIAAVGTVFGALLVDADPIIASFVTIPEIDVANLAGHAFLIGFFTWIAAGWAQGAVVDDIATPRLPEDFGIALGKLEVTAALGTLIVLFSTFVLAQLGWLFGGEQFLRERTGLTAAEYARHGFFQLVWIVLLVVPVLVATRAGLCPGRELARRHTALSLPVIGLLGAIIASAAARLQLYVHYYGLTTDRFYPLVFMGWLAVVLVWLGATVLRGHGRFFIAGAVASGLAVLAALNVAAPDAIVARVNIGRAAQIPDAVAPALDLQYLARLDGEAVALATNAVLAPPVGAIGSALRTLDDDQRCTAARTLLTKWGAESWKATRAAENGAWRTWNAGAADAMRVVAAHDVPLKQARRIACLGAGRPATGG